MTDLARLGFRIDSSQVAAARDELREMGAAAGRAGKAVATAAAVAGAGAVALVRSVADAEREIVNMARVAKASRNEIVGYAFATKSVGVEMDAFADISKDVQDKLGDFIANEGGEFADFFENIAPQVGLTAEKLQELSGPEVLFAVKDALDQTNTSMAEQVFYLEALGSDASLLMPLLKDNGKAMRDQANEAFRLGLALSDIDSQKLLDAGAASKRVDTVISGLTKRLAVELAPAVTAVSTQFADLFASGAAETYFDGYSAQFAGFLSDIEFTADMFAREIDQASVEVTDSIDFIVDAFEKMPSNIRAAIQIATVEAASFVDREIAQFTSFVDALNPFADDVEDIAKKLERIESVRVASLSSILAENEAATNSFDEQKEKAVSLYDQYVLMRQEREAAMAAIEPTESGEGGVAPTTPDQAAIDAAKAAQEEYQQILSDDVTAAFDASEQTAQAFAERLQRLQELREEDLISNEQWLSGKEAAETRYSSAIALIEEDLNQKRLEANKTQVQTTADIFGQLAQIAQAGGAKQFTLWKRMAQAQAAVSAALAVSNALASAPPPLNFIAAGVTGAAAAVQIAQIEQQQFQGSYEGGGFTGYGSRSGGIDGRGGFAAVLHKNESVIDHNEDNSKLFGQPKLETVINNNAPGVRIEAQQIGAKQVIDVVAADIASGGSTWGALASAGGLRRRGR